MCVTFFFKGSAYARDLHSPLRRQRQMCIREGDNVLDLMQKSTGYDLHLQSFPVGKVIGTNFAKAGAHILRVSENKFQLVVRRSFSDYIWLWIQQNSQEYGITIV